MGIDEKTMIKHGSYILYRHYLRPSWELPSRLGKSPADLGLPWAELLPARRGWAESYQSKELELSCKTGSRYTLVMGLEDVQWDKEDSVRGMGGRER